MKKITPVLVLLLSCFTFVSAQNTHKKVANFLYNNSRIASVKASDIGFKISSDHISSTSGTHHIYFEQTVNDIPILESLSSIHISKNQKLLKENLSFQKIKNISLLKTKVSISEQDAILNALKFYKIRISNVKKENIKQTKITDDGFIVWKENMVSLNPIYTRKVYKRLNNDQLVLAYEIIMDHKDIDHSNRQFIINASSGNIITSKLLVDKCTKSCNHKDRKILNYPIVKPKFEKRENCSNCYSVFEYPAASPYDIERTIVESPHLTNASPFGWHTIKGHINTITSGNNIEAVKFFDNSIDSKYSPSGGGNLNFSTFPFGDYDANNTFADAAIVNSFYWGNIIHDVTYEHGFNEAAGNFQVDNFEKGGEGEDAMIISVQKRDDLCNAFYSGTKDGRLGAVTLNVCNGVDGAFDTTIIAHEYGHGIVKRLVGGRNSTIGFIGEENTREGWADFFSLIFTLKEEDTRDVVKPIANYFFNQGVNGTGVRAYPYSTNLNTNPLNYDDIKEAQIHFKGSVWASILYDITWDLIDLYGFNSKLEEFTGTEADAGNIRMLAIAIEALKLVPQQAGFIDCRDALLQAYQSIYKDGSYCILWNAFARRGIGIDSDQGSVYSDIDGVTSFKGWEEKIDASIAINTHLCNSSGINILSGGFPHGGIYSGVGVIDNGDGRTFSFDTDINGTGSYIVYYSLEDSLCYNKSTASSILNINEDFEPPSFECEENQIVILNSFEKYYIDNYKELITVSDNCSSNLIIEQNISPGTRILPGESIDVELIAIDGTGNKAVCEFNIKVLSFFVSEEFNGKFKLFPNPANDIIYLENKTNVIFEKLLIFDINGKLVKTNTPQNTEILNPINIEEISTGLYFMQAISSKGVFNKRFFKK